MKFSRRRGRERLPKQIPDGMEQRVAIAPAFPINPCAQMLVGLSGTPDTLPKALCPWSGTMANGPSAIIPETEEVHLSRP